MRIPFVRTISIFTLIYFIYRLLQQNTTQQNIHGVVIVDSEDSIAPALLLEALYPLLAQIGYNCTLVPDYEDIDSYKLVRRYGTTTKDTMRAFHTIKNNMDQYSSTNQLYFPSWWNKNITYLSSRDLSEVLWFLDKNNLDTLFYTIPDHLTYRIPKLPYRIVIERAYKQALRFNYTIQGYENSSVDRDYLERYGNGIIREDMQWKSSLNLKFRLGNPKNNGCIVRMDENMLFKYFYNYEGKNLIYLRRADVFMPIKSHLEQLYTNTYLYNITSTADVKKVASDITQIVRSSYRQSNMFKQQKTRPVNMSFIENKLKATLPTLIILTNFSTSKLVSQDDCAAIRFAMLFDIANTCVADRDCLRLLESRNPAFHAVNVLLQRLRLHIEDPTQSVFRNFRSCKVYANSLSLKKRLYNFSLSDILQVLDTEYSVLIKSFLGNDYSFQPLRSPINFLEVINDARYILNDGVEFIKQATPIVVMSLSLQDEERLSEVRTLSLDMFLHEKAVEEAAAKEKQRKIDCYRKQGADYYYLEPNFINSGIIVDCFGDTTAPFCAQRFRQYMAKLICEEKIEKPSRKDLSWLKEENINKILGLPEEHESAQKSVFGR